MVWQKVRTQFLILKTIRKRLVPHSYFSKKKKKKKKKNRQTIKQTNNGKAKGKNLILTFQKKKSQG